LKNESGSIVSEIGFGISIENDDVVMGEKLADPT